MIPDRIETIHRTPITNCDPRRLEAITERTPRFEFAVDGDAQAHAEGGRLVSHVADVMELAVRSRSGDRASLAALETYLDMCDGCTEYLEDCICDRMCNECHDVVSECACAGEVPC